MIIGPRKDSITVPAEPSTHSTDIPWVIDLSELTDAQEITSPCIAACSGEEQPVSNRAITINKARFIGNPHRS
jgi:hypothetical protein